MEHFKMLIGGKLVDAISGKTMECVDTGTGEPFATVPSGGAADADAAVKAARAAFESGVWSGLSPAERCDLIVDLADRIDLEMGRISMYESMDTGQAISSAGGAAWAAVRTLRNTAWYAATKFRWREEPKMSAGFVEGRNILIREPLGVCVGIVPWNQPFTMAMWKLSPAIAAGNTFILKPSSETSVSALVLAQIVAQSKIPKGVINVVTGPSGELGEALCTHPGVNRISFTGSTATGKHVMKIGSDTLKHVTLELGGKSADIILEDADLDAAIYGALFGVFLNAGQVCVAGTRLLVHKKIYAEVQERLKKAAAGIRVGYALMPDTQIGSMSSAAQFEKVKNYVEAGKKEGAKLLCGGKPAEVPGFEKGLFFEPTIFVDVDNKMKIAQEEIFGPVLCVIPFGDDDEAVRIANDTVYGLAGGVWSGDVARAERIAARVKTGTMWVNDYLHFADFMPFGGMKQSGFGREFGEEGLKAFTELKRIYVSPEGSERPMYAGLFPVEPRGKTFTFWTSTKVIAGPGTINAASAEMSTRGFKHALVITDKGLVNAGVAKRLTDALGSYCAGVFDGVEPDTGYDIIDRAVEQFKAVKADCIISLGGGSSIDTGKGVAVTISNGGSAASNISIYRVVEPQLFHIAIPTTHGTGSEVTWAAVVENRELSHKWEIAEHYVTPDVAILDATLVLGLPRALSIGTGMDAFSHIVESNAGLVTNPITTAIGLHGIRLIAKYLPIVADNGRDLEARHYMLVASLLAGYCACTSTGIGHAVAHSVGTVAHVHHGTACGIVLPHVIRYNRDYALDQYAAMAEAFGVDTRDMSKPEAADAFADAVTKFLVRIGHPTRFRDVGMTEDMMEKVIYFTMTDGTNYGNPRPPTDPGAIAKLAQAAL
jgi:aldehyde dehydrogenase (NAD+)